MEPKKTTDQRRSIAESIGVLHHTYGVGSNPKGSAICHRGISGSGRPGRLGFAAGLFLLRLFVRRPDRELPRLPLLCLTIALGPGVCWRSNLFSSAAIVLGVVLAGGLLARDPLLPFVIREERGGYKNDENDAQQEIHGFDYGSVVRGR